VLPMGEPMAAQPLPMEFPCVSTSSVRDERGVSVGLALSGGFARGMAHIGVLKVLEEERIPIGFVAGTSAGALMGALYCSGMPVGQMERIASSAEFGDLAKWTITRHGLAANERMGTFISSLIEVRTFEDLSIPLAVMTTDFATGEPVSFRSGHLVEAVRASCAYPGVFLPVEINGRLLIDGVFADPVPSRSLHDMGCNPVLAVHLKTRWAPQDGTRHVMEVARCLFPTFRKRVPRNWRSWSDLIVEPDVRGFKYDEFDRAQDLIKAGESAMRAALPEFRTCLGASKRMLMNRTGPPSTMIPIQSEAPPC
jgi:NTE family protein